MIASALHRVGQFWRHSSATVTQAETARAVELLGPTLAPLFLALPANEQRHGLDVLSAVERLGSADQLLQQAALLHDIGKAEARFSVLDRSLAVFLQALPGGLFEGLLRMRPGYRGRYQIYRDHAALGAARLAAAGAAELAAVVAEHHATNPSLEVSRRLRRADAMN